MSRDIDWLFWNVHNCFQPHSLLHLVVRVESMSVGGVASVNEGVDTSQYLLANGMTNKAGKVPRKRQQWMGDPRRKLSAYISKKLMRRS